MGEEGSKNVLLVAFGGEGEYEASALTMNKEGSVDLKMVAVDLKIQTLTFTSPVVAEIFTYVILKNNMFKKMSPLFFKSFGLFWLWLISLA